jgi:CHAT domain-containing protein
LLLEYHAFDDQLVTFALSRDSVDVRTASLPTAELSAKVHRYHAMVSSRLSATADWEQYGADLAAALLDPVGAELTDHERVIVVPFGSLAMLPFHSLPFAGGDLGGQRVVSYLPAASAVLGRLEPTVATGPALVLGGLDYPLDGDLPPLPGTAVEARRIAELYDVEPLVGPAADRETVLDRLAEARVAHFATHGMLVEGAPYSSYLALSNGERLTVPDLVGLGLRTELAVLSACESGRGDATATGDVIGLTRALLGSGVRGLVVSLWPVDDAYACLLMAAFHEQLQALPAAAALAAAAAMVRQLTPDEALARYVALGGGAGDMVPGSGTVRGPQVEDDGEPGPAAEPAGAWHPALWAPFVYVGLP